MPVRFVREGSEFKKSDREICFSGWSGAWSGSKGERDISREGKIHNATRTECHYIIFQDIVHCEISSVLATKCADHIILKIRVIMKPKKVACDPIV